MFKIQSLLFIISLGLLISCSTNENIPETISPITPQNIQQDQIDDIIKKSGISKLRRANASWQELHENYLEVTKTYKDHDYLHTYTTALINHQVAKTSILDDVNEGNFSILKNYLDELKKMENPYAKNNYLIIEKLLPFVEKDKLIVYAKNSYEKGIKTIDKEKNAVEVLPESNEFEIELKGKMQERYEEEYLEYLPKLKAFLASAN